MIRRSPITSFRSVALVATLLSAAMFFAAMPALAVDVLFRGDSRAPETLFHDGFRGAGGNANMLEHLSGWSCLMYDTPAQRSAYVALTEHALDAQLYGRFVYRIVPDADAPDASAAVDAMSGLRDLEANADTYGLDLRQRSTVTALQAFFATPGQYVAMHIPNTWIQSVDEYTYDPATGDRVLVRSVTNPMFEVPARRGTRTRFTDAMISGTRLAAPPPTMSYGVARNGTTATACQLPPSDGGCGGSAQSRASVSPRQGADGWQCAVEPTLGPGSRFNQAVQLLLH